MPCLSLLCRSLKFVPSGEIVTAQIVALSRQMAREGVNEHWWKDAALVSDPDPVPIDRDWDWTEVLIEQDGSVLASELVGIVTPDKYIQGAMLISRDPVPSLLEKDRNTLFVELLFTAPRNRSTLRRDGKKYYAGIGPELLRWAVRFSRHAGFQGRLRLDGSPDYADWYKQLGFVELPVEQVEFEGVQYRPLELSVENADRLIQRESRG